MLWMKKVKHQGLFKIQFTAQLNVIVAMSSHRAVELTIGNVLGYRSFKNSVTVAHTPPKTTEGSNNRRILMLYQRSTQSCVQCKTMFYLTVWLSVFLLVISTSSAKGMQLGGITNSNVDEAEIQKVAKKAMVEINAKTNSTNLYKFVKVISARTQVVSGIKYYLTILAAPTTCKKAGLQVSFKYCANI
uniref:Cystatin domain-containing protein n=1 Tax=Elaeophora elaphi TaxID=1147741 RepID=A0A0R3RRT0_9BILA